MLMILTYGLKLGYERLNLRIRNVINKYSITLNYNVLKPLASSLGCETREAQIISTNKFELIMNP